MFKNGRRREEGPKKRAPWMGEKAGQKAGGGRF